MLILKTSSRPLASRHGFTVVELLIVIVVVAILAAITAVAFSGIQQRSRESRIVAQLSQARKNMELYRVEHGKWPFQDKIDEYMALPPISPSVPRIESEAWCMTVGTYLRDVTKESVGGLGSGSGEYTCGTGQTGGGSYACYGQIIRQWTLIGFEDEVDWGKIVYISSGKLGTSPVLSNDTAGWREGTRWCREF